MAGFVWRANPATVWPEGARAYRQRVEDMVDAVLNDYQTPVQNYMKDNAPWKDRSGNARQGLWTFVESKPGLHTLYLRHGEEYGLWLEIRWAGRWSIINPTLDIFAQTIWQEIRRRVLNAR